MFLDFSSSLIPPIELTLFTWNLILMNKLSLISASNNIHQTKSLQLADQNLHLKHIKDSLVVEGLQVKDI